MRDYSLAASLAATLIAMTGCSGTSSSSGSATAASAPAVAYDKRTGLPIYPGSTAGNYSDGTPKDSLYITTDGMQKVAAWYKSVLPSAFNETGNTSDYINIDKSANGDLADRVDLTPMEAKTRIDLQHYK
jgi:hypothetical protein